MVLTKKTEKTLGRVMKLNIKTLSSDFLETNLFSMYKIYHSSDFMKSVVCLYAFGWVRGGWERKA